MPHLDRASLFVHLCLQPLAQGLPCTSVDIKISQGRPVLQVGRHDPPSGQLNPFGISNKEIHGSPEQVTEFGYLGKPWLPSY